MAGQVKSRSRSIAINMSDPCQFSEVLPGVMGISPKHRRVRPFTRLPAGPKNFRLTLT